MGQGQCLRQDTKGVYLDCVPVAAIDQTELACEALPCRTCVVQLLMAYRPMRGE